MLRANRSTGRENWRKSCSLRLLLQTKVPGTADWNRIERIADPGQLFLSKLSRQLLLLRSACACMDLKITVDSGLSILRFLLILVIPFGGIPIIVHSALP